MLLSLVVGQRGSQLRLPLQLAGKLGVRGLINVVAPGQLVYITDQLTNRCFLVDTGAAFSILPHHSSVTPPGPALAGPNGCPIASWGDKPVQLVLDGQQFQWTFLLAAVQCPIIGVNFIRAHHLLVDPSNTRLVDMIKHKALKAANLDSPALLSSVDKMEGGGASVVFTQQKGVKRGSIYSLFHNKYLEDNKAMYIGNHSQKISNVCEVSL